MTRILTLACALTLLTSLAYAGDPEAVEREYPPHPSAAVQMAAPEPMAAGTTVTVTWTDNSNNEDGFKIERSCTGDAAFAQVGSVGMNVTSFQHVLDNTTLGGKTCAFRVLAFNTAGNSAYSNIASCVVPQPPATIPAAPTNAAVSP